MLPWAPCYAPQRPSSWPGEYLRTSAFVLITAIKWRQVTRATDKNTKMWPRCILNILEGKESRVHVFTYISLFLEQVWEHAGCVNPCLWDVGLNLLAWRCSALVEALQPTKCATGAWMGSGGQCRLGWTCILPSPQFFPCGEDGYPGTWAASLDPAQQIWARLWAPICPPTAPREPRWAAGLLDIAWQQNGHFCATCSARDKCLLCFGGERCTSASEPSNWATNACCTN